MSGNPYSIPLRALEGTQNTLRYIGKDISEGERRRGQLGLGLAQSEYKKAAAESKMAMDERELGMKEEQLQILKDKNPVMTIGEIIDFGWTPGSDHNTKLKAAMGDKLDMKVNAMDAINAFSRLKGATKPLPYGQTKEGFQEGLRSKERIADATQKGFYPKEDYKDALTRMKNIDKVLLRGTLKDRDGIETPLTDEQKQMLETQKKELKTTLESLKGSPKSKRVVDNSVLDSMPKNLVKSHGTNVSLPTGIKTTTQAIQYLSNQYGMTPDEAANWLRSQ